MRLFTTPQQAARSLKRGELLVYPTESVWGIGCDPFSQRAFEALLEVKNRPADKGVILLADTPARFAHCTKHLSPADLAKLKSGWLNQKSRATSFLVKPAPDSIPQWIMGSHETVALRVTPHWQISQLIAAFGAPIISTSCNLSGEPTARSLEEAMDIFGSAVTYFEGNTLGFEKPSRLIDLHSGKQLR